MVPGGKVTKKTEGMNAFAKFSPAFKIKQAKSRHQRYVT
jgi:hypothetical protein